MVVEHGKHYTDIDKWADVADDDYCYDCSKWIEADENDCCPICENALNYDDEYTSAMTSKVAISDAPKVNTYTGDIWNRAKGYVWGGGSSWWNSGSSAYTGGVSSMWGGSWSTQTNDDAGRMLKHKRHLDSLCKVVDPTVIHDLDWSSDARNYSDMNRGWIRIDGSLIRKSDSNLDITAGLAIHEKLHLIHSKPLLKWERAYRIDNNLSGYEGELLHNIANSVEDEYIEKQLAKDNAGFVTYIEAVKNHYFDTKMKGKLDTVEDNEFMDLLNTLLSFIRWPQHLDAERRKKHAKHIQFFARALAKGLDSRENTYNCIQALYQYLQRVAEHMAKDKGDSAKDDIEEKMRNMREEMGDSDLTEQDWDKIQERVTADIVSKYDRTSPVAHLLRDDMDKLRDLTKLVDYNQMTEALPNKLMNDIKEMEDSDYTESTIKDVNLIYNPKQKKITWRKAPNNSYATDRYKREAKGVSKITSQLKKKIDLYGNSQKHIIRNQKRGKIDKRMLHRIPVGRQDLFKCDIVQDDKPLDVCLLVDESGSMSYSRMDIARQSAISLKEALADNPKLNLWVHGHTADGDLDWHSDKGSTNLTEYWGPNMKDRPMALGGMRARYENRDGMAIYASAMKVKKESDTPMSNKLMIVLSDGQPAAWQYGGYDSQAHVKKVVTYLESQGWSIIQVGIGGIRQEEQRQMFNNHIFVDNISELAPKIGKIIRRVIKV